MTDRHTTDDRQTDRQTDTCRHPQTHKDTDTHATQTHRHIGTHTQTQTQKGRDRQTNWIGYTVIRVSSHIYMHACRHACIAGHCIALHYIALPVTALCCICRITFPYLARHYQTLRFCLVALQCDVLHYLKLHCLASHYIAGLCVILQ